MTRWALPVLVLICSCGVARADWPQLQADARRSGYSPDAIRPPFRLKWAWYGEATQYPDTKPPQRATVKIANMVQPIVVGGQVFVGAMDGTLYAIDAEKGTTRWSFKTGRSIVHTAAVADGIVVVNSMDGNVYGVDAQKGTEIWRHSTPYGIMTAPAIADGVVYVTTRDGRALALDLTSGNLQWAYDAGWPIVNSPAVHDGVLVFGAEDMHAHGVDIATGRRLWHTRLRGQSFRSSWPVAYKDMVILHSIPSISGSEMQLLWDPQMEALLDACPPNNWPAEREAILKYLTENPERQTVFVLDLKTGRTKYIPPIGYVAGNMYPPMPAVYDDQGRIYIYWRTRSSRLQGAGTYGTKYVPDISYMDPATGDRVMLPFPPINTRTNYVAVELDNNFLLTIGGDVLYGSNQFRVHLMMDLRDGQFYGITKAFLDERDGGYGVPPGTYSFFPVRGQQPPTPGSGINGEAGLVPVGDTVYINHTSASCIAAFTGQASRKEGGQ